MRRTCFSILIASVLPAAGSPASPDYVTYINANDILMFVTNEGGYGRDIAGHFGWDYGTFYPYTSIESIQNGTAINSPFCAGGLWLGGMVGGETRVTVAEYGLEYTPGPMSGGTFAPDAYTNDAYRVYKLYADSGASNPNTDYTDWPVSQGAPVDGLGDPLILGDQTLWSVFCDADTTRHTINAGGTDPLGIEVQQTTWASDRSDRERVIYMKYKLYNRGSNEITDFYVSIWLDPDLGDREDDMAGCDTISNILFNYNNDNDDPDYADQPPAFGAKLLFGPVVPSPGDTAQFDDQLWPDYRNLEMSSCATYINGADPADAQESYNLMRGYMVDGSPFSTGTRYRYPGDPVAGTGALDIWPTDKKQVASFGPIDFNPGDSQFVMIKLAVGQGTDRLTSVTDLKQILNAPDDVLTDVPADQQVALPDGYALRQNYPNPFNPSTAIAYELPVRSQVDIVVFNILGQRVRSLVSETKPAGSHTIYWDGADDDGHEQPSGVYFYRVRLGEHSVSRKMVLLK